MISSSETEAPAYRNTEAPRHRFAFLRSSLFPLLVLAAFWVLLIYNLGAQWSIYKSYGYGWAVPFLCIYLIYRKQKGERRKEKGEGTAAGEVASHAPFSILRSSKVPWSLSPLVLWSLVLCCVAYAPTRWLHEANPTWRLTSWLWSLEVVAITLLVIALADRRWKLEVGAPLSAPGGEGQGEVASDSSLLAPRSPLHLFFPIAFFLVAVPWPSALEVFLINSLTRLDVSATTELIGLFGIPAVPHGNTFEISSGVVGVDEACSGIRSFQATLMLSLFFGEFYSLTLMRRIICVLAGFGFSMIFNIGRTLLLVYVGSSRGIKSISNWHDPAGTTILVGCFVCLWILALLFRRKEKEERRTGSGVMKLSVPLPTPLSASGGEGKGEVAPSGPLVPWSFSPSVPSSLSFLLLAWLLSVELGTQWWYRSHETVHKSEVAKDWSVRAAPEIPGWTRMDLPPAITNQFRANESIEARWQDESGHPWQLYYFRWDPAYSVKRRVAIQLAKTHGPTTCLPASGLVLQSVHDTNLAVSDMTLIIQQHLFLADGKSVYVFYGIYEDSTGTQVLANRRRTVRDRIHAARTGSRNYGQRFLELAVWGYDNPEAAREGLQRELAKLIQ